MAEREQKKKPAPQKQDEVVEEAPATSESGEKIKAELDDLLDEIDEVLESNAEEFVKSYVQKGGGETERSRTPPPAGAPTACAISPIWMRGGQKLSLNARRTS